VVVAVTNLLGSNPVHFTDNDGNQISIPLSHLQLDGSTVKLDGWPPFTDLSSDKQAILQALMRDLVANETIKPDPNSPPQPAVGSPVQDPGAAGSTTDH
jgi:hypothetical protein